MCVWKMVWNGMVYYLSFYFFSLSLSLSFTVFLSHSFPLFISSHSIIFSLSSLSHSLISSLFPLSLSLTNFHSFLSNTLTIPSFSPTPLLSPVCSLDEDTIESQPLPLPLTCFGSVAGGGCPWAHTISHRGSLTASPVPSSHMVRCPRQKHFIVPDTTCKVRE